MAANLYTISATQGSTLSFNTNLTDSAGTYLNLSGYAISGYVKNRYSSTSKLLDLSISVLSATSGFVNISGSATGLSNMPVGIYVYGINIRSGDYVLHTLGEYFYLWPNAVNL